ncbi:MAG: hypothetical protein DCC58_12825 [Chloroflexi bacterium]|nr:MAG: hypothetical protein DCC58_12825 [Chloroflexota bacterium]
MDRLPDAPAGAPDADELLELYALDLLEGEDALEAERLLARSAEARERVRALRGVAAMLALDIEPAEASPNLKGRILAAARADVDDASAPAAATPAPIRLDAVRAARAGWVDRLGWAAAAVLALALVGSLVWNMQLRDELRQRPDATIFAVHGSEDAVGVTGEVVVLGDDGTTIVTLRGLPQLERGMVYQIWLIAGETPEPDVTFVGDTTGLASVGVAGSISGFDTLAITVEPAGGSSAPTSPPIILSDLTTQS